MALIVNDLKSSLVTELQNYLDTSEENLRELLWFFYSQDLKKIKETPREVHLSKEILKSSIYLNEKKEAINNIKSTFSRGGSLDIYLSCRSDQLKHIDYGLAHLGVHHLHLGSEIQQKGQRKGRVKGTKSLLFCKVCENDVYFINIYDHTLSKGFLNVNILRVLANNWPDLVEPFRVRGAVKIDQNLTNEDAAYLMSHEINPMIEVAPNKIYMMPGMGLTSAGTPLVVELKVNQLLDFLDSFSQIMHMCSAHIANSIHELTGKECGFIQVVTRVGAHGIDVYDKISGCLFKFDGAKVVISL